MGGKWNSSIALSLQSRVLEIDDRVRNRVRIPWLKKKQTGKQNLRVHLQDTLNTRFKHSWNQAFLALIRMISMQDENVLRAYSVLGTTLASEKQRWMKHSSVHHCSEIHKTINVGFKLILSFEKAGPLLNFRQHNICLFLSSKQCPK